MTCCKDYVTLWYANKGERADRRCPGSEMLSWEYGHEYTCNSADLWLCVYGYTYYSRCVPLANEAIGLHLQVPTY